MRFLLLFLLTLPLIASTQTVYKAKNYNSTNAQILKEAGDGDTVITNFHNGQWVKQDVMIYTPGVKEITLRVFGNKPYSEGRLMNGSNVLKYFSVPNTGTWTEVKFTYEFKTPGLTTFHIQNGYTPLWKFNWFKISHNEAPVIINPPATYVLHVTEDGDIIECPVIIPPPPPVLTPTNTLDSNLVKKLIRAEIAAFATTLKQLTIKADMQSTGEVNMDTLTAPLNSVAVYKLSLVVTAGTNQYFGYKHVVVSNTNGSHKVVATIMDIRNLPISISWDIVTSGKNLIAKLKSTSLVVWTYEKD